MNSPYKIIISNALKRTQKTPKEPETDIADSPSHADPKVYAGYAFSCSVNRRSKLEGGSMQEDDRINDKNIAEFFHNNTL